MAAIKGGAGFTALIMTTLIDDHDLSVPSLFAPVAITREQDATKTARGLAASGSDPGTFVWSRREDRVDCAIVLAPEAPYTESLLVSYVAVVGIGDALGALIPPVTPVTFGWPDRILINGATAGGIYGDSAQQVSQLMGAAGIEVTVSAFG